MSLKNPVTPPGIDPGIDRLVAQRLNHYATPGPRKSVHLEFIYREAWSLVPRLLDTFKELYSSTVTATVSATTATATSTYSRIEIYFIGCGERGKCVNGG
jgi:hypothetical protein